MKAPVPIRKMSKKQRKEFYKTRRRDWGPISPVTRKPPNPKAYDRKKTRPKEESSWPGLSLVLCTPRTPHTGAFSRSGQRRRSYSGTGRGSE